ncbi:MAG: ligase-associated DNA damage response endonuclease PdeM [Verrucomicrobiota bacterium]
MLEIDCAGERLQLFPEKAAFWPRTESLIVADLHFGKSAAFRKSGIPVPENTTASDLARLDALLLRTKTRRLIILGDFFHAPAGLQTEMMDALEDWCRKNARLEIILIPGNHDKKSGQPPACWNIRNVESRWVSPPFTFCHEPQKISESYVLSGHIHPAISLRERFGSGIRAPCFYFGANCAILPAFGSFTGMHRIDPKRGERIYAIGKGEIIEVSVGPSRWEKPRGG